MKKVLFVCTANICRSPMAEAIFNALASDKGLPFRAESAGTAALEGEPMAPNSVTVLAEAGIQPEDHRGRQVSEALLSRFDLVLAMTPQHVAELNSMYGTSTSKIYTLPDYATGAPGEEGIPDPYGYTIAAYRNSVRQLYEYIERIANRLES